MAPTPEEFATTTLRSMYGVVCATFVVIGVQLFMCICGIIIFFETPRGLRNGRGIYILVSLVILVLFSISQVSDGYQVFEILRQSNDAMSAMDLRDIEDSQWWRIGSTWTLWIVNWIGDGLLVYRCYVIWNERPWVCILPAATYLASIGVSIYTCVNLFVSIRQGSESNFRALSAWIYLSVAVNCIVTLLIAFRLVRMRQRLAKVMAACDFAVYLGVIGILVESALPLSVFGVVYATIASTPTIPSLVANSVFLFLWFSFTALSPQMIIFRVTIGRSWIHQGPKVALGGERDTDVLSRIEFSPYISSS